MTTAAALEQRMHVDVQVLWIPLMSQTPLMTQLRTHGLQELVGTNLATASPATEAGPWRVEVEQVQYICGLLLHVRCVYGCL